jgi:hypothetical protein
MLDMRTHPFATAPPLDRDSSDQFVRTGLGSLIWRLLAVDGPSRSPIDLWRVIDSQVTHSCHPGPAASIASPQRIAGGDPTPNVHEEVY